MCDSLAHAEDLSLAEGMRMVSPGDEPAIVLGHATVYLELFRRHPGLEAVYAPVGSGSGAGGSFSSFTPVSDLVVGYSSASSYTPSSSSGSSGSSFSGGYSGGGFSGSGSSSSF